MSTGGAVAASVAVIAAKKREEIFERLRECGALSPTTAMTLEELALGNNPMFGKEVRFGAVVEAAAGRYYLDEGTAEKHRRFRGKLMVILMAILLATAVVLWLVG